jgi:hypothetical protein
VTWVAVAAIKREVESAVFSPELQAGLLQRLLAVCPSYPHESSVRSLSTSHQVRAPDACSSAQVIPSTPFIDSSTTVGATLDGSFSCGLNVQSNVWYTFTPTVTGEYAFSTCVGASFDTVIEVFAFANPSICTGGSSRGCNNDACSLRSTVSVILNAGQQHVTIGGYNGASGTYIFTGPSFDCVVVS